MRALVVATLATALSIGFSAAPLAGSHVTKVYAQNGRRIAVIKPSNFGRKVYGEDGRRVAVIKSK